MKTFVNFFYHLESLFNDMFLMNALKNSILSKYLKYIFSTMHEQMIFDNVLLSESYSLIFRSNTGIKSKNFTIQGTYGMVTHSMNKKNS